MALLFSGSARTHGLTDASAINGVTYYYKVTAEDAAGNVGQPSAAAPATVVGEPDLSALVAVGARGPYGFYEALDYTRSRLPEGTEMAIVRAYIMYKPYVIFGWAAGLFATVLGVYAIPEYSVPVAPSFILLAAVALFGTRSPA